MHHSYFNTTEAVVAMCQVMRRGRLKQNIFLEATQNYAWEVFQLFVAFPLSIMPYEQKSEETKEDAIDLHHYPSIGNKDRLINDQFV